MCVYGQLCSVPDYDLVKETFKFILPVCTLAIIMI